ncbi:hypothetical protein JW905_14945 [bacterium]|nr:hypothetical protein [candidate division CSSED10-310 bacterium]
MVDDADPDNPKYDVSRWERALNGPAIRILHSVNDSYYSGETLLFWDYTRKSWSAACFHRGA